MTPNHLHPWFLLLILCLCLTACGSQPSLRKQSIRAQKGALDLRAWNFHQHGPVALMGEWELYWKQFLPGGDESQLRTSSRTGWFAVPQEWNQYQVEGKPLPSFGYATFRVRVQLPQTGLYSLYLDHQRTSYQLWINGRVIATNGMVSTNKATGIPQYLPQVRGFYTDRTNIDIRMLIANFHHAKGGFKHALWLGIPEQIGSMRDRLIFIEWFLIGSLLAMGLYHLIIFLYRKKDHALLYLAISCGVMACRQSITDSIVLGSLFPRLSWEMLLKIDYLTFYLAPPLLGLYIHHVFPKEIPATLLRVILALAALGCGITVVCPYAYHRHFLFPYQGWSVFVLVVVSLLILRAIKHQREQALLLVTGGMLLILAGVNDIFHALGVIHSRPLVSFALFLFLFFQSIVLALRFQRMARELYDRGERFERYIEQLRLDVDERQQAATESVMVYLPMDRRLALTEKRNMVPRPYGTVLFADISGFTPLTESLAVALGRLRGAEELIRHINRVYEALIREVHDYGGCVIYFSGDAITCWFEQTDDFRHKPEQRAVACGMAMQTAMSSFSQIRTLVGTTFSLSIKTAVVAGSVRRMLVGDPAIQQLEALAGRVLDDLATGEKLAKPSELLLPESLVLQLGTALETIQERTDSTTGLRFRVVSKLREIVPASPWPIVAPDAVAAEQVKPWLLKPIYDKVLDGQSNYLSELRTVSALFLQFRGIDYEEDPQAEQKLDLFIRWVQQILVRHHGSLLQLITGDKGSYLYAVFGTPLAREDDAVLAVMAAQRLQRPSSDLHFVTHIQIGVTRGQMRTGPYGSPVRRTYGAVGAKTNLAARLMVAAKEDILCDSSIYEAAKDTIDFVSLEPIQVKGKSEPVAVFRPIIPELWEQDCMDRLPPHLQVTLKLASLLGERLHHELLQAVFPLSSERKHVPDYLQELMKQRLLAPDPKDPQRYSLFRDPMIREMARERMLFSQRRQIHREVAVWYETQYRENLAPYYEHLIHHWEQTEDVGKTIHYLEKAGELARQQGHQRQAMEWFNQALALDTQRSVLRTESYRNMIGGTATQHL